MRDKGKPPAHSWREDPAPSAERQEVALLAAMQSCVADGNRCSCKQLGWQFIAEAHQCNARLSAAYETLSVIHPQPTGTRLTGSTSAPHPVGTKRSD